MGRGNLTHKALLGLLIIVIASYFTCGNALGDDEQTKETQVVKQGGIVFKSGRDFEIKCDMYTPQVDGQLPGLIVVHGGGWRSGTKFRYRPHAIKMAQNGYVVMCINYRHAPAFEFDDQVADVKAAVRWLKSNAQEYSVDPNRIGIWGYSAGGHLAAMVGTTDASADLEGEVSENLKEFDSRVNAVAIGAAPCDIEAYPVDSIKLYYWLKTTRKEDPQKYRRASPLTYVSSDDPPFFIFHGNEDSLVPIDLSKSFHEKLKLSGVETQFKEFDDYGHFDMFWYRVGLDESIEFFDSVLKK